MPHPPDPGVALTCPRLQHWSWQQRGNEAGMWHYFFEDMDTAVATAILVFALGLFLVTTWAEIVGRRKD